MSSGPESPAWGGRAPPQPGCIGPQELVLLQMALLWDRAWGWWPQLGPPPPTTRDQRLQNLPSEDTGLGQGLRKPSPVSGRMPALRRPECA